MKVQILLNASANSHENARAKERNLGVGESQSLSAGHGGRRAGAGRPRLGTIKKMYKLEPIVIERVKALANESGQTQSAIANTLLFNALEQCLISS